MALTTRKAMAAALAIGLPCLVAAADPQSLLASSWDSHHWAVVGVYGNAPHRAAIMIDRDTLLPEGKGVRMVNTAVLIEGSPPYYGAITRYRIDCPTMTGEQLYTSFCRDRKPLEFKDKPVTLQMKPDSEILRMGRAVCGDDWKGMPLLDVSGGELGTAAFASAPSANQ